MENLPKLLNLQLKDLPNLKSFSNPADLHASYGKQLPTKQKIYRIWKTFQIR